MRIAGRRSAACRGRSRPAFTLLELLLVIVILGILTGIAVARYANFAARQRLEAAGRRIEVDLALARRRARFSSSSQTVTFDVTANSYALTGVHPDHPSDPYVVSLSEEPYAATITSASFGGDAVLVFDGYGAPDTSGTIVIRVGQYKKTITVDADDGGVTLPPPIVMQ